MHDSLLYGIINNCQARQSMTQIPTEVLEIAAGSPGDYRRLAVTIGGDVKGAYPGYQLLAGFHFGADPTFGELPGVFSIGIDPVGGEDLVESWWCQGDVDRSVDGDVRISQCDDYGIFSIQVPDTSAEEFRVTVCDVYEQLLGAVRGSSHPHLAKIWNYFPGINIGDDDKEKYRRFSIGRADAFEKFGVVDTAVPTGTAVGCVRSGNLTVIALASKHDLLSAENPRQISAYEYPRQYGPRSPKFSRGGCVSAGSHNLLVYSGTAAIIGHESVHPYDVRLQTAETLENLNHLCKALSESCAGGAQLALDEECILRVYLRDPDDKDFVAAELTRLLGTVEANVVFLNADICRRELMIEIDGIRVLP